MRPFQLRWKISAQDSGKLVRDFLKEKKLSKRALTDIKFHGGDIVVNSERVTVRHHLREGEELTVIFPNEERGAGLQADVVPFEIVYEDEHCLVIDKPASVPSIPSREHVAGTVANGLIDYYQRNDINSTVHIVNRLDKDTSGLMLVAKHRFAHALFSEQQKNKQIHRTYEAIAHGQFRSANGTISKPIGRKDDSIIEREIRDDGQEAITHFKVLKELKDKTYLQLVLDTGRTHQIRVHLSSIGHPLCGDSLYGGTTEHINRQALHSAQLSFWHPFLERELQLNADLPEDMRLLVDNK
ncbi:RluA family pseudouridine synthase [Metabacillus malikii]|uniref:Pseudouridine synthase n=1 Tax=Metabacillus malikii TaxID=1504265 RepID=A0ABT9ZF75_9BACI|nr:RluA family pseudouridine synthase [Metabacillus malikii]MDQ0230625.1 23S rRNA pseudouridine1911/1915/1917 synthase [Metabacillus malikii]